MSEPDVSPPEVRRPHGSSAVPTGEPIPVRRVRFHWPDDFEPVWTPKVPELAIAANAVSVQMPYLEPFVVATVRCALDELPPDAPVAASESAAYGSVLWARS